MPNTPLLDKIKNPQDLKKLQVSELKTLAKELKEELVDAVSVTGGHLGAGLGVVELTIAIHYLFDTPKDRLVWDVGHQAYPHKILTERRDRIRTLRKGGGLSGFTKRSESIYDPFGAILIHLFMTIYQVWMMMILEEERKAHIKFLENLQQYLRVILY